MNESQTILYAGNLPDVADDVIASFMARIGPYSEMQINRKMKGEPFCHFSTAKPKVFLDATGRKLDGKKVLFQLAKRKRFDPAAMRAKFELELKQADERWLMRHPPEAPPKYYIDVDAAISADAPESFNDQFDQSSFQELHSIAFKDIPRRFYEPTEFKPAAQKKKPMLMFASK